MKRRITWLFSFVPDDLFFKLSLASVCFWVPIVVFAILANRVAGRDPVHTDASILYALYGLASPELNEWAVAATDAGGPMVVTVAALLLGMKLMHRKKWLQAGFVLFAVGGAAVTNVVLKLLFQRSRPSLWETVVAENSYSFPSGHAMVSSALAFCLIILAWHTRWRWPVVVGAITYTAIVGLTRMYLGVHYPTDVLAGWCISLAWVITVYVSVIRHQKRLKRGGAALASPRK